MLPSSLRSRDILRAEAPAASKPIPTTVWARLVICNEPEAINDENAPEIITIIVISGFARVTNALMRRVSGFDSAATARTVFAVRISLLALIRSPFGQHSLG